MGLCHRLSDVRSPRRRTACLAAQIQLASPTRQPKVQTTHQSPRSNPGQPVEAPHVSHYLPMYDGQLGKDAAQTLGGMSLWEKTDMQSSVEIDLAGLLESAD